MGTNASIAVVTVATVPYLPGAFVLGDSIREHCPNVKYLIGLVDKIPERVDMPYDYIGVSELYPDGIDSILSKAGIFGAAVAAKPRIMSLVLERFDEVDMVIFVDGDCMAYGNFTDKLANTDADIVISPHLLPNEQPPDFRSVTRLLRYGVYNSGLLAVRRSVNGHRFLIWWREMIAEQCSKGLLACSMDDQGYLDVVPTLFNNVKILSDPGINVGYWRDKWDSFRNSSRGIVNEYGATLLLFHFSGFSMTNSGVVSRFFPRSVASLGPTYEKIFQDYAARIKSYNNWESMPSWTKSQNERLSRGIKSSFLSRIATKIAWKLLFRFDKEAKLIKDV